MCQSTVGGMRFKVVPKYLKIDGVDNDGDGKTDELDEDVFELIVTGYYKNDFRRFASYLGSNSPIPLMDSALYTDDVNGVNLENNTFISGEDVMLDDSPGNPLYDVAGLAIKDPGTVADLSSDLTLGGPQAKIIGTGG